MAKDCPGNTPITHTVDCTEDPPGTPYVTILFKAQRPARLPAAPAIQRIALEQSPVTAWRVIITNCIPDHKVGHYPIPEDNTGHSPNPNEIKAQEPKKAFYITTTPKDANSVTQIVSDQGDPVYIFGITTTGIQLDPAPALWWDSKTGGFQATAANIWIFEALKMTGTLGMDCNNAHPDGDGMYHYHGLPPGLSLPSPVTTPTDQSKKMILCGYAADGFPVFYKYGYKTGPKPVLDSSIKGPVSSQSLDSMRVALKPSYRLKSGLRKDDPAYTKTDVPCGSYNGLFTQDYEYVSGLGDLDECNGRTGRTDEFGTTYYYVLTEEFPVIPRCFKGTPSSDFLVPPPD